MIHIMQGDAYPLYITIKTPSGTVLTPDEIAELEVMVGDILKKYPDEIDWDAEREKFKMPLTQEDTFQLQPGVQGVQARPLKRDGILRGWGRCGEINVQRSRSRNVLGGEGDG